jgi:uncharacterized phage protein gp47/JayE
MANIPVPRSYSEILGDFIDAFLSRYGLRALKIGSPVLSMFESAAQSDLRSSEDVFGLLEAVSLDQATGIALDRLGADESLPRETESPASGPVNIVDSSFTKVSSKVFQGTSAPIVGSLKVNVPDGVFPATGSVYIGRGSSNYEGPLTYTSVLAPGIGGGQSGGNYYTLVLSTGTLRFHNLGESVILAQGDDRDINAGTVVQTAQGNVVEAVQFRTLYKATIPDGETEIDGVTVIALTPGVGGNVANATITAFSGAPFTGATVTNAQPFTNGVAAETDDSYRERIRNARASRARGTPLALQTYSVGVTSPDENKRVLTASVVSFSGQPTTLYIDDGTGYEMTSAGVALESFIDQALGGEQYFTIGAPRPVTKAFVLSSETAPFVFSAGMQWAFTVGGVTSVHTISDDGTFRSIANATAYEWVASVNANPALNWNARTYANGTQVAVFAKADSNESIQYVPGAVTNDGNTATGFGLGLVDTMRLYRNDRLLNKDGRVAVVASTGIGVWGAIGTSEDLQLSVDGTPLANLAGGTYTFTGADFINAGTGYTSVGRNTPDAWAAVFNYRIPGITATVVNGLIYLTSNRGASNKASLNIGAGSSLVGKGMFAATLIPVTGAGSDYILDRNTGEVKLAAPLAAGDRLAVGSVNTRAFLETPALSTITIGASNAHLWFANDASAVVVPHGLTASTPVNITSSSTAWGKRERITQASGTGMFSNVLVGDWAIFWDPSVPADILDGAFRVAAIDTATGTWFEIERATVTAASNPVTFVNGGLTIARTANSLQAAVVPAGSNYTATSLATLLDTILIGAQATVYKTQAMRVNTATFGIGDIALVAADTEARKLQLPLGVTVQNLAGHLASAESGNMDLGTPDFHQTWTRSAAGVGINPRIDWNADPVFTAPSSGAHIVGLRPLADATTMVGTRYGEINGFTTTLASVTPVSGTLYDLSLRRKPYESLLNDRWYFASPYRFASDDSLSVLLDGDTESKRFIVPMWRTLATVGTTYAATNTFKDADNGSQSLAVGFGAPAGFDFNNFMVYMAARAKTHDIGDTSSIVGGTISDLTRTILWRYFRLGPDGNTARVEYQLPQAPGAGLSIAVDSYSDSHTNVGIQLASGALKTGYTLATTYPVGTVATQTVSGLTTVAYILAYPVLSMQCTSNVYTLKLQLPAGVKHTGLDLTGATSYYFVSTDVNFTTGNISLTGESQSVVGAGNPFDQVTFSSTHANFGPDANPGVLYLYGATTASLAGGSPAVAAGDFFRVETRAGLPSAFKGYTMRIASNPVTNPYQITGVVENFTGVVGASPTPTYAPVGDTTAFEIFANPAQTAAAIAAAVNALTGAPVGATLIGNGTGTIDRSSAEDRGTSPAWYSLSDGVNYVQTTTVPGSTAGDYQLLFKNSIAAGLATNSDWAHEVVKVVPRTAKNVVDWLNAPTVSGLFTVADIERSSGARRVQIASLTPGSAGSIEIQGGTANTATATILGSASLVATQYAVASIRAQDVAGLTAHAWVSLDNAETLPKPVVTAATALQSITTSGTTSLLHVSGSSWFTAPASTVANAIVSVEAQGKFWAITDTGFGGAVALGTLAEGDYIRVSAPTSPIYAGAGGYEAVSLVNGGNSGVFRVVRTVSTPDFGGVTVWVENSSGVTQPLAEARLMFLGANSVVPGDKLSISTPLWNGAASNIGTYTVTDVGNAGAGSFLDATYLTVSGILSTVSTPVAALGANFNQVQVVEGTPTRLIKQVLGIAPNATDATLYDVKFTTSALYGRVGATAGTVMTVLDKLGFGAGISQGIDGYQHTTGLIAEVTKVIQGDLTDTATYPGVAAAGATVNVLGPLVKRIQVTLSLRVRSGASTQDISARVKSAVASVINKTGVGVPIALSDLTAAAGKVGGVISVVMVTPTATAGTDLIALQPFEKALVLNVDQDVLVSFAGQ